MEKKMKNFITEGFIQECDINKQVGYNHELSKKSLTNIRGLVVIKYMARQGVAMSLNDAGEYIKSQEWRDMWTEVWNHPPSPGKLVFIKKETNIDKVVFNQHENTGEYNQHEIQGDI